MFLLKKLIRKLLSSNDNKGIQSTDSAETYADRTSKGLVSEDEEIKGCVHYIFVNFFFKSKREHLWNKEKMFFSSLQKLFPFSRKSNFRILDFQITWRHQMPKHKTRNIFYWITCFLDIKNKLAKM